MNEYTVWQSKVLFIHQRRTNYQSYRCVQSLNKINLPLTYTYRYLYFNSQQFSSDCWLLQLSNTRIFGIYIVWTVNAKAAWWSYSVLGNSAIPHINITSKNPKINNIYHITQGNIIQYYIWLRRLACLVRPKNSYSIEKIIRDSRSLPKSQTRYIRIFFCIF